MRAARSNAGYAIPDMIAERVGGEPLFEEGLPLPVAIKYATKFEAQKNARQALVHQKGELGF